MLRISKPRQCTDCAHYRETLNQQSGMCVFLPPVWYGTLHNMGQAMPIRDVKIAKDCLAFIELDGK